MSRRTALRRTCLVIVAIVAVGCSGDGETVTSKDDPAPHEVEWAAVQVVPTGAPGEIVALGGMSELEGDEYGSGDPIWRPESKAYWARDGRIEQVDDLPVEDGRRFASSSAALADGDLYVIGSSCVPTMGENPGCQLGPMVPTMMRADVERRSWSVVDLPAAAQGSANTDLEVVGGDVLLAVSSQTELPTSIEFSGHAWSMYRYDRESGGWSEMPSPPPISDGIAAVMPQMCSTGSMLVSVTPLDDGSFGVSTWAPGDPQWTQSASIPGREGAFPPVLSCSPGAVVAMEPERNSALVQSFPIRGGHLGAPVDVVRLPVLASGVKVAVDDAGAILVATQEEVVLHKVDGTATLLPIGGAFIRSMQASGDGFFLHDLSGVSEVKGDTGEVVRVA